ncbi:unnamed protein product [Mytilus coruscus]|uniref:HMCN n=1 Tax=Mytilus coruscus TaxID=42192 RepID=A0A6J8EQA2_MYTCO|nr:unnamed protein product [Mytilus coruscus]
MNEIKTIYASTGSHVMIKCPYDEVNIWQYSASKDVLALCENGKNIINKKCNVSDRINVSSDCQLEIQSFTTQDLNIYICTTTNGESTEIHVELRNIIINEASIQGIIHGVEGKNLTLTCTVNGFLPGDTLYWTKDTELLASGNTSSLHVTLQIHRSYEHNSFICMANNSKHTHPLLARMQLNILLKPAVSITVFIDSSVANNQKSIIVRQGQHLELKCQDNSNASGDVEIFSWLFNGNMIKNKRSWVVFNKTNHERSGLYTCMASNKAGNDSDAVNITVTYSPIVRSKWITFNKSNRPRSIDCEVSGEPNTYNISWSHYTNNNQLVRKFNSCSDRKLILPEGDSNDLLYEDSGVYVCSVTNGITDESGKLWQKGEIKVVVKGKPVLAKPQRSLYLGNFNGTSSISLFVLSSSNELKATWKNENGSTLEIDSCSSTVNQTLFNGKLLNVAGYQCVYQIQNTQEKDFQNYTVDLRNKNGIKTVEISLVSSRAPEVPEIFDVYQRHNDIVLEWKPKFDGGEPQSFIVQYRKDVDEIWKSVLIQLNETRNFVLISNPHPNTKYVLRMLAFNRIGNSSFTGLYTVLTDDVSESTLILSRVGAVFNYSCDYNICQAHRDTLGIYWQRSNRNGSKHPLHGSSKQKADRGISLKRSVEIFLFWGEHVPIGSGICRGCREDHSKELSKFTFCDEDNEESNIEDDVPQAKKICLSSKVVCRLSVTDGNCLQYENCTTCKFYIHSETSVKVGKVTLKTSQERVDIPDTDSTETEEQEDEQQDEPDEEDTEAMNCIGFCLSGAWMPKGDSAKLNYIEIAFDPVQLKGKFYIHGNDNRTPYADIDFTAKVDPIISLDESDDSSSLNENNEDDFVSLEDVQQWNIHSD